MPIYEYYCPTCAKEISIWFSSVAQAATRTPVCADCGSQDLTRLISNVAAARSGDTAAPQGGATPQGLAQTMRAAGAGRDMGKEFNEVASRLEKGESATSVERTLRKRVGEDMQAH